MGGKKGYDILHNSSTNKSTAFSHEERHALGLRGLLPYAVSSLATQQDRSLRNMRRKTDDIEKYIYLVGLQERNERLFYRLVIDNIDEIMPLIYTPTVGQACREFAHIFRNTRGFYITPEDRGSIRQILDNWPQEDVRVIVVTDGQRILGLGDLGANGMGIPIGKLALYVAGAGIDPSQCLPVMLDVGTDNEEFLNDPLYLGYPHHRLQGQDYLDIVDEFIQAVQHKYPKVLVQFEDFLTPNAFKLLDIYRDRILCFNDDIQGTAAVTLAGIYASTRITDINFADLRIMFLGAGSAATGIGDLIVSAFTTIGLSEEEARQKLWFVNSRGLVVKSTDNLLPHIAAYAHDYPAMDFISAINDIKPHILIGATGRPGTFTEAVIKTMAGHHSQPTIFALSNPTSQAECTAEQAYHWSDGKAIFASGSPFATVSYKGREYRPGQGNNSYVFPGIGMGAVACNARVINDEMFLAAARTLADQVDQASLDAGTLYPPLADIRKVSLEIAVALAEKAYESDIADEPRPHDLHTFIKSKVYNPLY
ncbi:MAG: NAD-dependent malic enzyme [Gammaproteobacteria bacterium]|nr:NAD-dependent malic enzyme [Gammaproteobacteria bacterium]